jgi:3-phenylpropionate/trans-cinnamate dioxygenase ferredoxin reductase component
MKRVVIVGAGLAGHRAAIAVREAGFTGEVVVIGDEPHRPYDRPPLSKQLLAGTFSTEQCFFDSADIDVTWRLGEPVVALDAGARALTLEDGSVLGYDGLIIGTGRRARSWPASNVPRGVHTMRTIDDAMAFRDAVIGTRGVVIIGAGFIGCEVAATLLSHDVENVTVVDVAPHPMPVLGAEIGRRAARLHEQHGVRLRMQRSVSSIDGDERVEAVTLSDGERIEADTVLVAIGSAPNSEWLNGSGVLLADGSVVCDRFAMVRGIDGQPLADVVAAGDIASWPSPHGSGETCIEHWSNARDMAAVAAANLLAPADERAVLESVPTFWSDQYHVKIKSAGFLKEADRFSVVSEDPAKPSLVAEAYRDDELVGAVVFNMNRTIIDYTRRLRDSLRATATATR